MTFLPDVESPGPTPRSKGADGEAAPGAAVNGTDANVAELGIDAYAGAGVCGPDNGTEGIVSGPGGSGADEELGGACGSDSDTEGIVAGPGSSGADACGVCGSGVGSDSGGDGTETVGPCGSDVDVGAGDINS